nr:hypothetical protein [Candidatus Collinsella stercoripullorum]
MGDGNLDVAQIVAAGIDNPFIIAVVNRPLEHVGRDRSIIRSVSGNLSEFLAGEHDALEILDLSVVAKRVGEGQIANGLPADVVIRLNRRRCTGTEAVANGLEDSIQRFRAVGSIVVLRISDWITKTETIPSVVNLRVGILTRHRVHIFIEIAGRIGRVSSGHNADGVHTHIVLLKPIRCIDGTRSNASVETVVMVRLAIGKEDDDLLRVITRSGICSAAVSSTLHHAVSKSESIISRSCTSCMKPFDIIGQSGGIGREVGDNLGVIVVVTAISIRIITDAITHLITGKLYQCNTMLIVRIGNLSVLSTSCRNKAVDCILQRVHLGHGFPPARIKLDMPRRRIIRACHGGHFSTINFPVRELGNPTTCSNPINFGI